MENFYIVDTKSGLTNYEQLEEYLTEASHLATDVPSVQLLNLVDTTLGRLVTENAVVAELETIDGGRVLKGNGIYLFVEVIDQWVLRCSLRRVSSVNFDFIWRWLISVSKYPDIRILSMDDSDGLQYSDKDRLEKYYAITGDQDPQNTSLLGRLIDRTISRLVCGNEGA